MRESRKYGSARGALSNERPYRDREGGGRPDGPTLIFGDIEGKLDVLNVECTKCARKAVIKSAS